MFGECEEDKKKKQEEEEKEKKQRLACSDFVHTMIVDELINFLVCPRKWKHLILFQIQVQQSIQPRLGEAEQTWPQKKILAGMK